MKKTIATITLITMIVILSTTVSAKSATIISEKINRHTFKVERSAGVTMVKWNNKVYHRYDFKGKVKMIPERKLTYNMRTHRKGKFLYIERIVGKVVDNKGNGITSNGNPIKYTRIKPYIHKGDVIITYCVYSPYTNWFDDIDDRFDVIL